MNCFHVSYFLYAHSLIDVCTVYLYLYSIVCVLFICTYIVLCVYCLSELFIMIRKIG
jgi:hypothetical protein